MSKSVPCCGHANECPSVCPCPPDCYCRTEGSCGNQVPAIVLAAETARLHITGCRCTGDPSRDGCPDLGFHEYGGLCAWHWLACTDAKRAALFPHYLVPREIRVSEQPVIHRHVIEQHNHPPAVRHYARPPLWLCLAFGLTSGFGGSAAFYLLRHWLAW